jgi:hypothetical protein
VTSVRTLYASFSFSFLFLFLFSFIFLSPGFLQHGGPIACIQPAGSQEYILLLQAGIVSPKGYPQRPPCCLFLFSFIFLSPGFLQHGGRWGYPFGDTIPACRSRRKEKEKEAYSVRTLVMAQGECGGFGFPPKI